MGRKADRKKYIRAVALNMTQEFKVKPEEFFTLNNASEIANALYEKYGDWIYDKVCHMTDEAAGRLAACGVPDHADPRQSRGTSLWDILREQKWAREMMRFSGADILHTIAQMAIIAAMCDLVIEQHPHKHQIWRS